MSDNEIGEFIAKIMQTLDKNGFPAKKVALPLEKMYENAYAKGFSFNKVLDFLSEKGISHEKTTEKVIFFSAEHEYLAPVAASAPQNEASGFNMQDAFAKMGGSGGFAGMMKQAQEMMAKMSPEQLKSVQDMVMKMSPAEREEMMRKAKDSGIVPPDMPG